ncbi:hypothetical protein [Wolbachia pipientis]|uniref:hypothetical protein n=2 Tax=Wolbachieae TaxID=952 RepID=UPI0002403F11|nr:hypothetical protein [Wolbachia pipientis]THA19471.1 hypothetical protein EJE47_07120 [Wolbachia endosymbiont of Aedes albopictus]QBB84456.1 hypothetical protein DEJ70_03380 [Wolbachia pipientis wAlbB]QDW09248.1 hypothetical protein CO539_003365 [Wolbachia pipientis]QDW10447.1 hypothetical protein CO538_003370 [Wolbachia pipientis]CCE77335.1 conserved membrane hypothetical protein [Wolbachia pipientis wAlbB]
MDLKNLQQELLGIIFLILAPASAEEERDMKERALEIIGILKDHINDDIEMNNLRMTILDCIILCDSQDNIRLNNRSLLDLEDAVKSIGGKTPQELGRVNQIPQQPNSIGLALAEATIQYEVHVREMEERNVRIITSIGVLGITALGVNLGKSKVSEIIGTTLGGLLSMPIMVMLPASIAVALKNRNSELREVVQYSLDATSKPSRIGLVAALGAGAMMLINNITSSSTETNMELLGPGFIAATGAGIGAALSTALARRMFATISTNLENVAAEQQNIQGQSI